MSFKSSVRPIRKRIQALGRRRRVVYTCLFGYSEKFLNQDFEPDYLTDFVCFTDDEELRSDKWKIIVVPKSLLDPHRRSKGFKHRPHLFFPRHEFSLYVDNTVKFKKSPLAFFNKMEKKGTSIKMFKHPERDCIYEEAEVVKNLRLDDPKLISEQMSFYRSMNYPEKYGLHATTIILRRHNDSLLKEAMSAWHDQVLRYSKRDQLSFDMVKHYFDLKVETFDESLLQNEFFQWPVFYGHGRLPRDFDDAEYLSINPDVALSKTNPRKHYLEFGMASGRPYRVLPLNDTPPTTHFEVDPRDQRGKELKLSQTGQLNETTNAMWKVLLKESDWTDIVDIGANYGEMLVGANIPPLSSVIAIEQNPTIFPLLRRNLIAAGVKCDCLALAISDGVGLAKLNIDLRWSGLSTLEAVPDSLSAEKEIVCVPMMSLDALFGKVSNINKMRLLTKIDIEGHEISALKGMHNLINSSEKFAALVEVLHLSKPSKAWLLERFEIEVYNLSTKKLKKITPLSIDKFEEVLLNEAIYKNDIVIRAR